MNSDKPIPDTLIFAGLGRRCCALIFDFLLLSLLFFPITRLIKGTWMMTPADHRWSAGWFVTDPLCLWFLLIILLYFIFLEGLVAATVGKLFFRIRVVSLNGGRPGLLQSAIRNLLRLVDSLPAFNILGVILIVRSPQNARFGDRVAATRVIRLMK